MTRYHDNCNWKSFVTCCQGVFKDYISYVEQCLFCGHFYQYQTCIHGIHNYDDRFFMGIDVCLFLKAGLYDEIFLSRPWNFYFEIKVSKYFRKRNVSWNIIQFVHTIKFHSYDHDNVSFIERINNFHFSCHGYYSFKSCLKILKKRSQLCC